MCNMFLIQKVQYKIYIYTIINIIIEIKALPLRHIYRHHTYTYIQMLTVTNQHCIILIKIKIQ